LKRERIKAELIVDALKALEPGDLSIQTKLLPLLGKILVFVSYWDNTIKDLASNWLNFALERTRQPSPFAQVDCRNLCGTRSLVWYYSFIVSRSGVC